MVWRLALTHQLSFANLPDELLLYLLRFFSHTSLFHIGFTSKRFKRICRDQSLPNIWKDLVLRVNCRPGCATQIQSQFRHRYDQLRFHRYLFLNLRNITKDDLTVILERGLARGPVLRRIEVSYQRDSTRSKTKKNTLVNISMANPDSLNVQHEHFPCLC